MEAIILEEEPLDVGYASEAVELSDTKAQTVRTGGQTGATQLLIALPRLDGASAREIEAILPALGGVIPQIVLSTAEDLRTDTELPVLIDDDEAFGDLYGVRIGSGSLSGHLAKALFVISKDGAIFYEEVPIAPEKPFNAELLVQKCAAAHECYTGKGCH